MLLWTLRCMYFSEVVFLFFYKYIPRSGLTGSDGSALFSSWRHGRTVSIVGCTISPTVCKSSFSPHLHQHVICVILIGVRWYLISLGINNVKHLFVCLWSFGCLPWKKMSTLIFSLFFNQVVCFMMLSCMNCLYRLDINPLPVMSFANYFLPFVRLSFCFVNFFHYAEAFKFN